MTQTPSTMNKYSVMTSIVIMLSIIAMCVNSIEDGHVEMQSLYCSPNYNMYLYQLANKHPYPVNVSVALVCDEFLLHYKAFHEIAALEIIEGKITPQTTESIRGRLCGLVIYRMDVDGNYTILEDSQKSTCGWVCPGGACYDPPEEEPVSRMLRAWTILALLGAATMWLHQRGYSILTMLRCNDG